MLNSQHLHVAIEIKEEGPTNKHEAVMPIGLLGNFTLALLLLHFLQKTKHPHPPTYTRTYTYIDRSYIYRYLYIQDDWKTHSTAVKHTEKRKRKR